MKKNLYLFSVAIAILLSGCGKPEAHPKNPKYEIEKPKVKYKKANKKNLGKMVKDLQGCPYVWAEEGPYAFDCSGLTYYLYGSMGVEIPRTAREQAKVGQIVKKNNLKYGDLIFFDTTKNGNGNITHVGMYLGDDWFTHASTVKYEVVYSKLSKNYYKSRLKVCRRYLPKDEPKKEYTPWKAKSVKLAKNECKPLYKKGQWEATEKGQSYIQVGSYTGKPTNAILNKISSNGFKYRLLKFPKNGVQINKLLIGPYKSRSAATNNLEKVKSKINSGAFLIKIE